MALVFCVLLIVVLGPCCHTVVVEGLEFLLNDISIPNNGSGPILVTDINSTDAEALICQSPSGGQNIDSDWYLDPEDENATSIADADRINGDNDRGWTRTRDTRDGYRIVRLKRVSDTAVEGRFTCRIRGDSDSPRGLLILYPITDITATIEEVSIEKRTFRVRCTSTGGRVLNMSVTRPGYKAELRNIQAVGTLMRMGNDTYSSTLTLRGGNGGRLYNCIASNGLSFLTASVELRGTLVGVTVETVLNPLSVRVSWPAVVDADRYIVTFKKEKNNLQEGLCEMSSHTVTVSVNTTLNANIAVGEDVGPDVTTMLRAYTTYAITVVAENDTLGTNNSSYPLTFTTPQMGAVEPPQKVTVTAVQSTTISIKWKGFFYCRHVNGLTALFRIQYSAQPNGTIQTKDHVVNSLTHKWYNGARTSLTGLTPYTNYSIQVAAVNIAGYVGKYSDPIMAQTAEDTPGPVVITAVPSFLKITITWNEPAMPNGIITHYEVYYGRPDILPSVINTIIGLNTSFTTPGHLEPGTEMVFTVKAYTQVGDGESATVAVSTLTVSSVVGVTVIPLTHTSVQISWNALIIPGVPFDSYVYTVVYSPVSQSHRRQDEGMTAVFPGSVTSGVITDLEPAVRYQFQVFATVTEDGMSVEGKWSVPFFETGKSGEYDSCSTTPVIIGVIIGVVGVVVGTSGLIIGGVTVRMVSKTDVSTEDNPAYGINKRCAENMKDYEIVQSPLAAPQGCV